MFSGKPATVLEDLADFRAPPYAQDAWQALVHRAPLPPSPVAGWLHFRCQAFASLVTAAIQECPPRLGSRPIEKTVVSAPHPLRGLVGAFH